MSTIADELAHPDQAIDRYLTAFEHGSLDGSLLTGRFISHTDLLVPEQLASTFRIPNPPTTGKTTPPPSTTKPPPHLQKQQEGQRFAQ